MISGPWRPTHKSSNPAQAPGLTNQIINHKSKIISPFLHHGFGRSPHGCLRKYLRCHGPIAGPCRLLAEGSVWLESPHPLSFFDNLVMKKPVGCHWHLASAAEGPADSRRFCSARGMPNGRTCPRKRGAWHPTPAIGKGRQAAHGTPRTSNSAESIR